MSAQLEHAWLFSDPDAEALEVQRTQLRGILSAISPSEHRSHLLNLQIEAKVMQANLLSTATFGTDMRRKRLARTYANLEISNCQSLLFES